MAAKPDVTIFGIRHHGPGSARSLVRALEALQPDCLLVEGPSDANEALPLMLHQQMEPPVALLGYVADEPKRASYYPFAIFSPEWQALRFALERNIKTTFMDLPFNVLLALEEKVTEKETDPEKEGDDPQDDVGSRRHPRQDPLLWLAEAAGYSDGERWWEHMVEERRDSADIFAGILEAMGALRKELPQLDDDFEMKRETIREAHMRATLRAAQKEGFERIAVVCGAWHA